ncbi:4Fe-4S dicluster domain-containing protein [Roseinatronobacter sp. S2]|uniref:4Fe-4S dicluster domain-containing protein n=1 Tax=Roseinatronobacter sp. S2 TaxID=3035471 RepID=UPI00240FB72D|nr:4Fe-4S dicluster domain-containing protein [Roseinatronobacter sp. S2]WFE75319.1 4Fe-4S dicluster domain-containing protein [Roseinatronobacter sp. S2]
MEESAEIDLQDKLSLDAAACLTIRRPDAACTACADICPAQAIRIDARAIELDHDRCTGCARCVVACPTGALMLSVSLAKTAAPFECSRVAQSDRKSGAQVVPCLGGLSATQLLERMSRHGQVTLVDRGWCAGCPSGGCAQPWGDAVQSVQADLADLGHDAAGVQVIPAPTHSARARPAPQPRRPRQQAYSRRQLFRRLTTPAPAPDLSRVTTNQPFSGKVGTPALERRRDALCALHGADTLPAAIFPALDCTGIPDMRFAASLCPTHALTLTETADADSLTFDAALCIGCGDCEKADGLHLLTQGAGQYDGPVTLVRQIMADCPGCLRRFAPRAAQSKCDACHKDNDLAASAFGLMRRSQVPYGA